jgi:hypothetical protein
MFDDQAHKFFPPPPHEIQSSVYEIAALEIRMSVIH